ncbi:MAG: fatty acid desaturase [Blastochloris sp.]|jgi:stearoyl-CoA desaturase (delta-9 desaturase)|nr:fatty acid desaturase [Blastochloris sp.]
MTLSKFNIPWSRVEWVTCFFLGGTLLLTLTAVPWYILTYGLDWFQVGLFFFWFFLTGMSITFGYHRLFSHRSFQAKAPLRLVTLLFGAAAFENSALDWSSDHRRHHKHVDHEDDPYDISKGFFYAHLGWMLFKLKPLPPMENVADLRKDPLVMWQHRYWHLIGFATGFILPTIIGYLYGGPVAALGAFLISGVARTVAVQHSTFCINSACHTLGTQPYSNRCSAKDSWVMALFTFGEGYHNFHHEFQHDYRNGVKPWQFDPTKWMIWTLNKVGLTSGLRQVPNDKITTCQENERLRRLGQAEDIEQMTEENMPIMSTRKSAS